MITFESEHGLLKDIGEPAGTRAGYDDLRRAATREPIGRARGRPSPQLPTSPGCWVRADGRRTGATLLALRKLIQVERRPGLDIDGHRRALNRDAVPSEYRCGVARAPPLARPEAVGRT